jgi:hypothetical protein
MRIRRKQILLTMAVLVASTNLLVLDILISVILSVLIVVISSFCKGPDPHELNPASSSPFTDSLDDLFSLSRI